MNYNKTYSELYKNLIKDIREKVLEHGGKVEFNYTYEEYNEDDELYIYDLPHEYYIDDNYAELHYIVGIEVEDDKLYFIGLCVDDDTTYYFDSISIDQLLGIYELLNK